MLNRFIQKELEQYLKIMPVVLLTGARQAGKTTLVESIAKEREYTYFTFDDEISLSNAKRDPSGWVRAIPKPVILDEVQRVPEIFLPIKRDVDQQREPGRYILTGSANPLLLPNLGDSLAGRMGMVSLYPFSQAEIHQRLNSFIPWLFEDPLPLRNFESLEFEKILHILLWGGFPVVQNFPEQQDVSRWIRSYLQTMMERDVRDISNIAGLREFPRLFRLLATRSGSLLNVSELSRTLGMVNVTLNRYLRLLETLYFIYLLPGWTSNLGKRIVKSPKLHLCDTAFLSQSLETNSESLRSDPILMGQFLESFVFTELLKQRSWSSIPFELYHFRDGDYEVDFVLESPDGTLVAIEVKSSRSLQSRDLRGLKHFQSITKKSFKRGIILHLGDKIESLGDQLWAVPLQALWS